MTSHLSKVTADNNKYPNMDVLKKKPKWESKESDLLIETVVSNKNLDKKFSLSYTSAHRSRFWRETTEKINAVGGNNRSVQQVEKKWRDLKSQTKSKEVRRREEMKQTGGGVASIQRLSAMEEKILGKIPTCTVEGIPGGKDIHVTLTDADSRSTSTQKENSCSKSIFPSMTDGNDSTNFEDVNMQSRTDAKRVMHSATETTIARHAAAEDKSKESTSEESDKERSGSKRRQSGSVSDYIIDMEGQQLSELQTISQTLKSIDSSLKELVNLKKKKLEADVDFLTFEI